MGLRGRHLRVWATGGAHVREARLLRVTLIVQDDGGALGFATADTDFTIMPYEFSGPSAPLVAGKVNAISAGRAMPVRFGLGGAQGLQIFGPGYPKVQPCGL